MAITIYRVCRRIYANLDGEGSRRVGGRWNSPGRSVVYMAHSVALAVLENLVHMSRQDYPTGYVVVAATVPVHVRIIEHLRYLDAKSRRTESHCEQVTLPGIKPLLGFILSLRLREPASLRVAANTPEGDFWCWDISCSVTR
jgi:hypothetical protein